MLYEKQTELLERKKRLGLTHRDLANVLQMPPSTIANKLSGFIPLSPGERRRLELAMDEAEQQQRDAA